MSPQGDLWDGDGLVRAETLGHSADALAQQAGRQAAERASEPEARAGVSFANLLPPVADGDSRRSADEQRAEAPSAQDSNTRAGCKPGLTSVNPFPAAAHDNRGDSLPVGSQPAEQFIPNAAGDIPAVSDNAVPGTFSEAEDGGASDRETAAAAAEVALPEKEGNISSILLNSLSLCSPSARLPRPAGQPSSQTDRSYAAATDEALVHSVQAPSLFANVLPQPNGQPTVQEGSSSAAPDWAAPGRAARSGQGQHTEATGAGRASRRELFRQKVAAAQAGARRQPELRPVEAGRPDASQPRLRQAEPGQGDSSQSEKRQVEPAQPELMGPEAASASPVTATGGAPSGSAEAAAGDVSASMPEEAPATTAGLPGRTASSGKQIIRMHSEGGADPAMPEDCSSSTASKPEKGKASEARLPKEAVEESGRSVLWVNDTALQGVTDPDEDLILNIRRMSAVKHAARDAQSAMLDSAAPKDASSSSSSSASGEPEEAALSADDTDPAEEAEGTGAEVHWAENTALEEGTAPEEGLLFAIRRMSAAVRERTSPVLAGGETAVPAESALSSPQQADQAGRGTTAQKSGSIDTIEPIISALSTPASDSPSRHTGPGALDCATSALHLEASTDTASQLGRAGARQAAQAVSSPARTGFEHLLARFVGSPAELDQSAFPASSPLAPTVVSEPLGERLIHTCAVSGKDTLALRAICILYAADAQRERQRINCSVPCQMSIPEVHAWTQTRICS